MLHPRAPSVISGSICELCIYAGPTTSRFVCIQDKRAIICTSPSLLNHAWIFSDCAVRTFAYEDSLGPASPYTMFARVDGLVVYCRFKKSWIRVSCTAAPTSRRHLRVYLQYPFVKSAHMIDNPRPILASVLVLLDSFSTQNLLVSCAMQSISAHDCREGWYPWSSLLAHACDWLVVCIGRKIEPYW